MLDALWGGDETLIVVSSDLSHYLPYADAARDRPRAPPTPILALVARARPRAGLRRHARQRPAAGARRRGLDAAAARPAQLRRHRRRPRARRRLRVVRVHATHARPTTDLGHGAARASRARAIGARARHRADARRDARTMRSRAPGATFVTLRQRRRAARLHRHPGGAPPAAATTCAPTRVAAAFRDPRFAPLAARRVRRDRRSRCRCCRAREPLRVRRRGATRSRSCARASTAWSSSTAGSARPSCRRCGSSCPSPRDFLARAEAQGRPARRLLERRACALSRYTRDASSRSDAATAAERAR